MPAVPVILIFGPTAVGKTQLLTRLFERKGEVINVDSMQVYRELDIGTAKADIEDRRRVPHHLLDIRDPRETFTVADFVHQADRLAVEIHAHGKWPVLCGGTAFYFKHFLFGLPLTPPADPDVRAALQRERLERSPEALYTELQSVDPSSAARIEVNDSYRVCRALEVYRSVGKPLSSFRMPVKPREIHTPLIIGLERPREELYRRIDRRVDRMFDLGLAAEVKGLLRRGYGFDTPGMRGIGYREWGRWLLRGCGTRAGLQTEIRRNSRRYAKRQFTFFRTIPGVQWFHPENESAIRAVLEEFRMKSGSGLSSFLR